MKSHNYLIASLMVSLAILMLPTSDMAADASKLQISSPMISEVATIPTQFTCGGDNQPPPLAWTGVPTGTKSMALLVEDPDAPAGTFVHWVVYDISPSSRGFKAREADGKVGTNSMGRAAYMGPCPPPGNPHHYHFRLFALDTNLDFGSAPDAQAVRDAMKGHIKESTEMVGIFGR